MGGRPRDRGSVTAELAIALPGVVLVLVAVLLVTGAAVTHVRCTDAARAGARLAALGATDAEVAAVARDLAGEAADVSVVPDGEWVTVRVSRAVRTGPLGSAGLRAAAEFTARVEPTGTAGVAPGVAPGAPGVAPGVAPGGGP